MAADLRIDTHPILGAAPCGRAVIFFFNGRAVTGREGEPIATALWVAGIKALGDNSVSGQPRGLYCGIGHCFECRVEVDGRRSVRACLELVRAGMQVRAQRKDGAVDDANGGG